MTTIKYASIGSGNDSNILTLIKQSGNLKIKKCDLIWGKRSKSHISQNHTNTTNA